MADPDVGIEMRADIRVAKVAHTLAREDLVVPLREPGFLLRDLVLSYHNQETILFTIKRFSVKLS